MGHSWFSWMVIPPNMRIIGFDPSPYIYNIGIYWIVKHVEPV
jgi:hypothetical protein